MNEKNDIEHVAHLSSYFYNEKLYFLKIKHFAYPFISMYITENMTSVLFGPSV